MTAFRQPSPYHCRCAWLIVKVSDNNPVAKLRRPIIAINTLAQMRFARMAMYRQHFYPGVGQHAPQDHLIQQSFNRKMCVAFHFT